MSHAETFDFTAIRKQLIAQRRAKDAAFKAPPMRERVWAVYAWQPRAAAWWFAGFATGRLTLRRIRRIRHALQLATTIVAHFMPLEQAHRAGPPREQPTAQQWKSIALHRALAAARGGL